MSDEPPDLLARALQAGIPWPLALEAIASTALDHDPDDATHHPETREVPPETTKPADPV